MSEKADKVPMDQATEKLVEWMNGLEQVVLDNSEKIEEITGQALDMGLMVITIGGIQDLVVGVLLAIASLVLFWLSRKILNALKKDSFEGDRESAGLAAFLLFASSIGCGVVAITFLLSIWSWVQVFYPELYVAKMVTESVIGQ